MGFRVKVVGAWRWPPTTFYRWGRVWVDLYVYRPSVITCHVTGEFLLLTQVVNAFFSFLVFVIIRCVKWTLCNDGMKHLQDTDGRWTATITQAASLSMARLWTVHSMRLTCRIRVRGEKFVLNFGRKT